MSQHKISMSRQKFCSLPVVSVITGAFMSRQAPPGFDIQHKKPCRNIISLCLGSLVTFFSCFVATHCHLLRHSFSSILSPLCCDIRNTVVTFFLSHSLGCLSQHTETLSRLRLLQLLFFSSLLLDFSPFWIKTYKT